MNFDWLADHGLEALPRYLTALGIGLLIGLERERNPSAKAGLRTCALVALAGAISAGLADWYSAPAIIAVGVAAVALMMIAAYFHDDDGSPERDPGTTTVVALLISYLLGALAVAGHTQLALMLGIVSTLLLYFKAELGGAARHLDRRELVSILQFAVVAFVVLPLLPDRGFGPREALNPRNVWLMVVLISGVSLAGYLALHLLGRARGAVLTGALGGLVSSTATTLAYSRSAGSSGGPVGIESVVIVTANLVLLVRVGVLAAFAAPDVLSVLGPVLGAALAAGAAVFALASRSEAAREVEAAAPGNPAQIRPALAFAVMYALVLLLVAWVGDLAGSGGVYAAAAVSGLLDLDAITLSSLRLHVLGTLSTFQSAIAIVLAIAANSAFKLAVMRIVGGKELFKRCFGASAAAVAAAGAMLWLLSP